MYVLTARIGVVYYCSFSLLCWWSRCLVVGVFCFFFQAEDGIRDLVRSRGLGDVYKRQPSLGSSASTSSRSRKRLGRGSDEVGVSSMLGCELCLLYTSDAADERSSVDLGGRRIIKKKKTQHRDTHAHSTQQVA